MWHDRSAEGINAPGSVMEHSGINGNYLHFSSPSSRPEYCDPVYPIQSLSRLQDVSTITFILHRRERRPREVKYVLEGHTGFDLNLSGFKAFIPSAA